VGKNVMNVALVGPTCAGKTTCSSWLVDQFPLHHLSTGQLLRENRAKNTALGLLTRRFTERGELVPDEIINAMIEEAVRKLPAQEGLLLDGFPSTLFQARFIETLLQDTRRTLDAVIVMNIPDQIAFDRAARRIPRRPDDRPDILRRRVELFRRTTGPVLDFFRQQNQLAYLDASGSIDAVCAALSIILEGLQSGHYRPALEPAQTRWLDGLLQAPAVKTPTAPQPSLDLVIMGPPASGKGTHAAFLSQQLSLPHIATGNLFRENLSDDTILGKIARTYIDRGELVPDDVSEAMIRERLARTDTQEGFILDGFPRTVPQARALDEIMDSLNRKLDRAIYLAVPDEEIVYRISGRRYCPVCQKTYHLKYNPPKQTDRCDQDGQPLAQRDDDTVDTIQARLKSFHGQTVPVIDYYRQAGLLLEVSATGEVADVDATLLAQIKSIKRR
jgi:adenylate kinase